VKFNKKLNEVKHLIKKIVKKLSTLKKNKVLNLINLDTILIVSKNTLKILIIFLPSVLVLSVLTSPEVQMNLRRGQSVPAVALSESEMIDTLFPNSGWNDLEPCGIHFNEQLEFETALQCVNKKVWADSKIPSDTSIPRCFILKAKSPDVFTREDIGFNFIPIMDYDVSGQLITGAVVGYYQTETRTVFVVENIDAPMVYRHELQHYFLHIHDPETGGGGHWQNIWDECEPPYYTPSDKVKTRARNKGSVKNDGHGHEVVID
jgi:hypothetical protein